MQLRGKVKCVSRQREDTEKWREFESAVARIQTDLAPECQIERNVRLEGRQSGRKREIDVAIRHNVGQYELLIVIDCKDYKRPVDVKHVEAFMGLVEDVEANKGALVSSSGFSKAATERARKAGIDLYRLVDAKGSTWKAYVTIPFLCDFRGIKQFEFTFSVTHSRKLNVPLPEGDHKAILLYDKEGGIVDCAANLLNKKWMRKEISIEPGILKNIPISDSPLYLKVGSDLVKTAIRAEIHIQQRLFFGQVPLEEIEGFEDQIAKKIITRQFTTVPIDVVEVEKTWQQIDSEEDLAIKPIMGMIASDEYPLIEI